ncbi:MAG: flagellar hook-basal body complex protein FliE [Lachnospiraceae bacterium]|nr:flagellar hook-basal body complex protein FliE [Lachnospiraceae bacterium]
MNIGSLYNINSQAVRETAADLMKKQGVNDDANAFAGILQTAMDNINTTNSYLSEAENEELRFALGETENTHDLMIAMQKASTALQYTVAIRDRFLESYKELMNMQV